MIVNSVDLPDALLQSVLKGMGSTPFSSKDLQGALEAGGVAPSLSAKAAKRLMQRERKAGSFQLDAQTGLWRSNAAAAQATTGPAPASSPQSSATATPAPNPSAPAQTLPFAPQRLPAGAASFTRFQSLQAMVRFWIAFAACMAAVLALVAINASFAWEMAENDLFRIAFVAGLMASDLMRPLLMAHGFWSLERKRLARGAVAVGAAVFLAPASILSSTTVISATLHLGAEEVDQGDARDEARLALQTAHDRLQAQAAQAWRAWELECARGGCGPRAARIEADARALEQEAQRRLDEMLVMTHDKAQASTFLSRSVKALQDLGLFGGAFSVIVPLLLAMTLEVAALLGPAVLLTSSRPRPTP